LFKIIQFYLNIYIYINMSETEVFRITPVVNRCYEHAEYTRKEGRYPNERYFTNIPPRYVGEYIRSEQGGWGDGGWKRDYFRDLDGTMTGIDYSYEGRTSFREAPCRKPPPLPLEAIQNKTHIPSLKSLAFYQQPTQTVSELRENNILGGKFKKYHKKSNRKTNKKRKYKKTRKSRKNK
jgi:hypothetical protein